MFKFFLLFLCDLKGHLFLKVFIFLGVIFKQFPWNHYSFGDLFLDIFLDGQFCFEFLNFFLELNISEDDFFCVAWLKLKFLDKLIVLEHCESCVVIHLFPPDWEEVDFHVFDFLDHFWVVWKLPCFSWSRACIFYRSLSANPFLFSSLSFVSILRRQSFSQRMACLSLKAVLYYATWLSNLFIYPLICLL